MKILLVRMTAHLGGAEIYSERVVERFKKSKEDLEIYFITNLKEFAAKIKKSGGEAIVLSVFSEEVGTKRGLVRLVFALPKYLFYFLKEILFLKFKKNVNLAVLQGTTEKIVLTPLLKMLNFRVIWLEHGPMFRTQRAKEVLQIYKLTSKLANKIIAVSKDTKADLINGGIEKEKVVCVYAGMSIKFKKLKKFKKLIVGFVGAICWEKGIRDFVNTAVILARKMKNVRFLLVGRGPQVNWAKKVVKVFGLEDRFTFTGWKKDVWPYLAKMDLFFFPTLHLEGLSFAILEAMAMGVPVVARDIGGNRELVVQGKTGYLFKDETPEELAEIMIKLLKDKKKREAMGMAAQERIKKYFSEERWIKQMFKVFKNV